MPWPIDTIVRTVSGTFISPITYLPRVGTIAFTSTSIVTTSNGTLVIDRTPILLTLDITGAFSIILPVSDNHLLTPVLWSYDVTINLYGSKPIKTRIVLPFGDGTPVNLPSQVLSTAVSIPISNQEVLEDIDATVLITTSVPSRGPIGPTGAVGAQGLVPTFTRQGQINPLVGGVRFYFDSIRTIAQIRASVGTPSVGSPIVIDTFVNGISIGTTSIPAGTNTMTRALAQVVNSGDYATVSIVSVGSTIAGSDLTVTLTVN